MPSDIGECIGHLLEGRRSGDVRLESTVLEYQNRTEFSDHVADCFSAAVSKSKAITLALSNMDEQFYGVKSDVINEILKFYFPEQFGDRHFLSYPIGQFILSLYSMWDEQAGLIFNDTLIRECLSVNIWGFHGTATPISVYERIKGFISDLSELNAIIERLKYLKATIVRIGSVESNPIFAEFPFFSLSEYDVGYFIDILMDIKSIADELFVKESGSYINFREHFKRLISMIGMRITGNKYVSDQERQLVSEVQNRLSSLKTSRPIVGNIDDLKQTIHYYLRNESEDKSANWIVRNFEQIDGGILLSPYTRAKTYHLALLSDRNMKQLRDEFFPWPLTAEMLESQKEISQNSKTILTSYKEYRNFLRYCVFYGTYFLDTRKHIQFSYVEESEADKDIPYYILTLLGLKVVSPDIADQGVSGNTPTKRIEIDEEELRRHIDSISKPEQEVFVSCPYRFLLNHVLEEKSCFAEEFDSRRLYSLLLFSETWQKNVGIPAAEINNRMLAESERIKAYFPFWKTVDYIDLENTAYRYLNNRDMIKRDRLQEYHPNYVRRKMTFKDSRAKITKPFEYKPEIMRAYLHSTPYREPVKPPVGDAESLCRACNQRNVCMRKYLLEE